MRALVVYESVFGDTREVAESIADGLRTGLGHVDVRRVADADVVQVMDADLLIVGGPTHAHGMSRPQTRAAAVAEPKRYHRGEPAIEPGAGGIGLREWFDGLPHTTGAAAAFDTRAAVPPVLSGRASTAIAKRLRRGGYRLVDQPHSFRVTKGGGLKAGEVDRAKEWGLALARSEMGRSSGESRRQRAD